VPVCVAELQKLETRAATIGLWMQLADLRTALVRHPDPTVAPFEFNGSLTKLSVREKLAAEDWSVSGPSNFSPAAAGASTQTPSRLSSKRLRITWPRSAEHGAGQAEHGQKVFHSLR
jgi:hypothetical protein